MIIPVTRKAQEEGKWKKYMPGSPNNNQQTSESITEPYSLPSFFNISLLFHYLTFVRSFITFKRKGLIVSVVSHLIECQAIQLYQPHRIN